MIRGPLSVSNYKGQFSGHETFPLRQLWLRKAFDAVNQSERKESRRLFSEAESIVTFGVGKNMASSIRHWALACGVIKDNGNCFVPTRLGKFLFDHSIGHDPYMESLATVWLLHWMIAGSAPPYRTTTWFYAFNNFPSHSFDRADLAASIQELCDTQEHWPKTSTATIKRDVECFIRSYVVQQSNTKFVDDNMETVLTELGLIQSVSTKSFQFRRGPKPNLPDGIFLFALHEFWQSFAPQQNTLAVESIVFEPGSPGRAFKLDEFSLTERLAQIDDVSGGRFKWSESAGVRHVTRQDDSIDKWELLSLAYPAPSIGRIA